MANGYNRRRPIVTDSCATGCWTRKAIITKWSIRKTEAERLRQLPQSSSTLKSGTFSVITSQLRFECFACRRTIKNKQLSSRVAAAKSFMRRKIIWFGVVLLAAGVTRAQTETPANKKEIQITWLGHA